MKRIILVLVNVLFLCILTSCKSESYKRLSKELENGEIAFEIDNIKYNIKYDDSNDCIEFLSVKNYFDVEESLSISWYGSEPQEKNTNVCFRKQETNYDYKYLYRNTSVMQQYCEMGRVFKMQEHDIELHLSKVNLVLYTFESYLEENYGFGL